MGRDVRRRAETVNPRGLYTALTGHDLDADAIDAGNHCTALHAGSSPGVKSILDSGPCARTWNAHHEAHYG